MKIIFFVENNHAGGMDSFFINVINNWPHKEDELCLICNSDHPGLPHIKNQVKRQCQFFDHDILLSVHFVDYWFVWLPANFRRILRPFVRMAFFQYQLKSLISIFKQVGGDRLLSVNGAYPGGETSRIANIAWNKLGRLKSVHNIRNFAIPPRLFFKWYENRVDKLLEESVNSFIGVSKCCAESLRVRPVLKNSKKIHTIYNGVPFPEENEINNIPLDLRSVLNINDSPLCLMLGTYELRKGHEFLFKVFNKVNKNFPDAHLVICGGSTSKEYSVVDMLRKKLAPNANIHLLDFVPMGKLLINQADMLIVGSQEWESFGWTVIESMTRGIPVVSTNAGGLAEVIGEDGVAGYSIDPNDIDRFTDAICGLIQYPYRREAMGIAGKDRVIEHFTVKRMAKDYAELIRSNLKSTLKE